jgi:hypothetical protein
MSDLRIQNEGSIFLVHALTDTGRAWLEENIGDDAQTFGNAIVVEHRYISDIVAGAFEAGLEVT